MGNISSTPDEGASVYLRDQNRLSISHVAITSPRKRTTINIVPNAFPATRISASRVLGDHTPIEFVQDPETSSSAYGPAFLLKLSNEDDLVFTFTFVIRRTQQVVSSPSATGALETTVAPADTQINGLTYVYASTPREVENLVTREFHADPNLHKNSNVELVGDYSTGGHPSVSFDWMWRWKPPKNIEDKGGGWRNSCSFVEYDQRAHRLHTLASFSFFVANTANYISHPSSPSPPLLLNAPPKLRVVSAHSVESRISTIHEPDEPPSPHFPPVMNDSINGAPSASSASSVTKEPIKVDVSCPRPGDDMSVSDDGPVFRATMKALEQKTGNMRTQMKRLIKKAEQVHAAQIEANDAFVGFMDALKEVSSTNANAVQPAIEHYFDKIAREILSYERQNTVNLQKIVIEPMTRVYQMDIKQAEVKKRDFEEESKDFYAYVSRYLGQRHDSVKAKQSDSKYQSKRKNFELKRFDYSSFMQDLSGGRKEQEILSHLTKYADAQARCFLTTAKKVDELLPQLEALSSEVQEADKEYQYQRREREEKRRLLEKSNLSYGEPEPPSSSYAMAPGPVPVPTTPSNGNQPAGSDSELGRADSTGSQLRPTNSGNAANLGGSPGSVGGDLSRSPGSLGHHHAPVGSPQQNAKFRGIRDLEERDPSQLVNSEKNGTQRKEGLLWALNRPGGHVDPRNLNKQGWHKFWIVLDQGKLSEYSNWKQKLDLHMDPIDLRLASVREARNAERRFCFEVITPHFKRVYQATSEEDMNSWIMSINNALQSAVEGRAFKDSKPAPSPMDSTFSKRDIGSILTGKSSSVNHHNSSTIPLRRTTVGARPGTSRGSSFDENPDKLLQMLRENDQGNAWCADCGSNNKVEWVSLNLAIIVCIECSGIHRSLGTHISKVRSLTLDTTSFTPDIIELLLLVGNRVSNMVFEARLDPAQKLTPQATREQRLRFITAKYVERAYVEPISATLSRYPTPDETLLAAIKRNEIQQVIYALALRASPNVTDKSRGTHAVFVALAAADPASPSPSLSPPPIPPSSSSSSLSASGGGGATASSSVDSKPFPVAELLIQNGAEIPNSLPAFPLSRAAQSYLELKRGRRAAIEGSSSSSGGSYDGVPSHTNSLNNNNGMSGGMDLRLQREREARLQKRVSAGGRLAKSPIPER
ncbi:hypothetical protein QBC46DRAFT_418850 [Diplogelasinospora grovesii]|uniref:ADP-ribosylation factor GTPase-activating protein n=1 Tax=Diplogelasinospora grovesii TaxID=303347 RepID=A0AAN6NEJ3_9PEZI|nr:hypothetical protein QBC46DRAFT_418850 [Diplogelasinospora grovesii]